MKDNNKLKNLLTVILIFLVTFLFISCIIMLLNWSDKNEIKKLKSGNTVAIGTIIKTGSMKGDYVVAEYYVNNKRYEKKESSPWGDIQVGEHFEVMYYDKNPEESRIDYTHPVFLKGEATGIANGTIYFKDWVKIGFYYIVDGVRYKRFQKLAETEDVKTGQTYPVCYLISNPKVSNLRINQHE